MWDIVWILLGLTLGFEISDKILYWHYKHHGTGKTCGVE